jgi:hypothetical protein
MKGEFTYIIYVIFELLTEPADTNGMFIFRNRLIFSFMLVYTSLKWVLTYQYLLTNNKFSQNI